MKNIRKGEKMNILNKKTQSFDLKTKSYYCGVAFMALMSSTSISQAMQPEDFLPQKSVRKEGYQVQKRIKKEEYQAQKDRYEQNKIERHLERHIEEGKQGNDGLSLYHLDELLKILDEQEDRHLAAATENAFQNGEIIASTIHKPKSSSLETPPSNLPTRKTVDVNEEAQLIEDQKNEAIKGYFKAIKKKQEPKPEHERIFNRISQDLIKDLSGIKETFKNWKGPLVILIGETGSGKTTLAHSLTGQPMNATQDPTNSKRFILNSTIIKGEGKIVNGLQSGTTIPGLWKDPQGEVAYADCPGLGDTGGILQRIKNANYIGEVCRDQENVRFLIVEPAASFQGDIARGTHFLEVLKTLKQMFPKNHLLKNGLSLVVTQHHALIHKDLNEVKAHIAQLYRQKENHSIKDLLGSFFGRGQ